MTDYNAYLVRIWHANDEQRLRIIVKDAYSDQQAVFTDFARLDQFMRGDLNMTNVQTLQQGAFHTNLGDIL